MAKQSENYNGVKPYSDEDISLVLDRITRDETFPKLMDYVFPGVPLDTLIEKLKSFQTIRDFQMNFMAKAVNGILKKTSAGLSYDGLGKILPGRSYLYLANHRDIILDSSILQLVLVKQGMDTTEIAIGDNLMISDFVTDIGKLNKMILVKRNGSRRDLLQFSQNLSRYIRDSVTKRDQSFWIAHRNGRTKNGDDRTDAGLLKMLYMSGAKDFVKNLEELRIVPVAISYEIEPCAFLKTREIYMSQDSPYVKKPGEDLESILTGLMQDKGRIHLSFGDVVHPGGLDIAGGSLNEKLTSLARHIDACMHRQYKLWPNNYIAYDLLYGDTYSKRYSPRQKREFQEGLALACAKIKGDPEEIQRVFLEMYGKPVENKPVEDR